MFFHKYSNIQIFRFQSAWLFSRAGAMQREELQSIIATDTQKNSRSFENLFLRQKINNSLLKNDSICNF